MALRRTRHPGFGGVCIRPKLFCSPKEFIKEIKATLAPFLSEEEAEEMIRQGKAGNTINIFIAEKEYQLARTRKENEFKTFVIHVRIENAKNLCGCVDGWFNGCCGGPLLNGKRVSSKDMANPKGELREELTNYFIR